ncbi:MAG: hypothetical protein V7K92_14480 [Nostoc sp.]
MVYLPENSCKAIETAIPATAIEQAISLRHGFTMVNQKLEIVDEAVENENANCDEAEDVYFFYRYQNGRPALKC